MTEVLRDKRFLLAALLVVAIAATFWTGSRYPSLNEKAALGGALVMEDPLGFDPVLHLESGAPFAEKIVIVTLNWLYTNRQGMAFGVLLGAAMMTLLGLLRRVSFESAFANTLLGVVVGAPLGVCVNCAAPIARGLHAAGARLETALAAMISSPTLNVVVLAMLFSLFPLYLVTIKLGLTLLFLLVGIPALTRYVFRGEGVGIEAARRLAATAAPAPDPEPVASGTRATWGAACAWLVRELARHLWFIARTTVPLMLLAGLLGALVVTVLPWETLTGHLPHMGRMAMLAAMGLLTVVGLVLPVPMAFDVVVAAALLAGGAPIKYVAVLLFTLGIFSVYSFMIVGRAVSWRVASVVSVVLLGLGMTAGVASHLYAKRDEAAKRALFLRTFRDWHGERPAPLELPEGTDPAALLPALRASALAWTPVAAGAGGGLVVERRPFRASPHDPARLFTRQDGAAVGLVRADNLPLVFKFTAPYHRQTPIASGDVHGDGRPDVLLGSDRGLYLFANRDGERFVRQRLPIPALRDRYVVNAALVDLNDDGWLDVFGSIYRGGNFVVYNDHGRFEPTGLHDLPPTRASLANAVGFGDLDRDGRLEIVLGNWTAGDWTRRSLPESRDVVLRRAPGGFRGEDLPGPIGETLSVLLSDLDSDGWLDLIVGNDFSPPDVYYRGTAGGLRLIERGDGLVPHTTRSTMSIDSADLDNDLRPEVYLAQVTGRSPAGRRRLDPRPVAAACDEFEESAARRACRERASVHQVVARSVQRRAPALCLAIASPLDRADCVAYHVLASAGRDGRGDRDLCALFPPPWEPFRFFCEAMFRAPAASAPADDPRAIPQIFNSNVLLAWGAGGRLEDRAVALGLDVGGWAWNAKFADLDHDEWQDLYLVNGHYQEDTREPKMFFRNQGGAGFALDNERSGLGNYFSVAAYTYVDVDDDGDLDIVEVANDGPILLYRNAGAAGNAIVFELRDQVGNAFGIGSRLVIHYGPGGARHQMREIKASGGFLSFDPPEAHFGLGLHEEIARVEIRWSTGERSQITGPLAANHRYRLTRPRR